MTNVVFVVYTADFWEQIEVNGRNSVRESSAILISAEFNISPHYLFMVQNQITVLLCLTMFRSVQKPQDAAGRHTPPQDTISSNIVGIVTVCTV